MSFCEAGGSIFDDFHENLILPKSGWVFFIEVFEVKKCPKSIFRIFPRKYDTLGSFCRIDHQNWFCGLEDVQFWNIFYHGPKSTPWRMTPRNLEKIEKTASTIKTAENRPPDPCIPEKNMSRAFQRVSRIALKLRDIRENGICWGWRSLFQFSNLGLNLCMCP